MLLHALFPFSCAYTKRLGHFWAAHTDDLPVLVNSTCLCFNARSLSRIITGMHCASGHSTWPVYCCKLLKLVNHKGGENKPYSRELACPYTVFITCQQGCGPRRDEQVNTLRFNHLVPFTHHSITHLP